MSDTIIHTRHTNQINSQGNFKLEKVNVAGNFTPRNNFSRQKPPSLIVTGILLTLYMYVTLDNCNCMIIIFGNFLDSWMYDMVSDKPDPKVNESKCLKMYKHDCWQQESIGPGWIARDLSEIKPGGFSMMRRLESQYDSLRQEDVRSKASTDPMYKYYKRLLPKPR